MYSQEAEPEPYDTESGVIIKSENIKSFTKSSNSDFYTEFKETGVGIWVDTSKWIVTNRSSGISFKHKDKYFLETNFYYYKNYSKRTNDENAEAEIDIWEGTFSNFNLKTKETRNVNGTEIIFLDADGDFGSTPETMLGYSKATENGTITFRAVIATKNLSFFEADIIELLNGLVVKQ